MDNFKTIYLILKVLESSLDTGLNEYVWRDDAMTIDEFKKKAEENGWPEKSIKEAADDFLSYPSEIQARLCKTLERNLMVVGRPPVVHTLYI